VLRIKWKRGISLISHAVKDVFSKGFASVREDDTLFSCLSLFKKEMPPVLVVLDSEGKYKSVIARRWIVSSGKLHLNLLVKKFP
jgi:predicted transcriptional regulator